MPSSAITAVTVAKQTVAKSIEKKRKSKANCVTGLCCGTCKPDYSLALAMGMHGRLGEASPLAYLTDDLLSKIIENTTPKRALPEWMSCTWKAKKT